MKSFLLLACVLTGLALSASAEMRIWTSVKGDTIEAEFVKKIGSNILMTTAGGKQLKIPMRGLCKTDLAYIASVIPPEFDIDVDIDKDSRKLADYDGYVSKRDSISGEVIIKQTNPEKCNRSFKACLYVFAKDLKSDSKMVILKKEHSFDCKSSRQTSFVTDVASVQNRDYWYDGKKGMAYHGYLIFIEDSNGNIIEFDANQKLYEDNVVRIKTFNKGDGFDRDFRKVKVSSGGSDYWFF
jgi:hypothetical protein